MTETQVRTMWGKPYLQIEIPNTGKILCYKNEGHPVHMINRIAGVDEDKMYKNKVSITVQKFEEIEERYSDAELFFDTQGQLEAFTCIGEETYIHSRDGEIKGSSLKLYTKYIDN